MELESYKDGTLLHIGTAKGGKLQVNDLLAIIRKQKRRHQRFAENRPPAPVASLPRPPLHPAAPASGPDVSKWRKVVPRPSVIP